MTMEILLARVDSRLLHGQVATAWAKRVKPNRILVVSDSVADDTLRKTLITQAAPPGVLVNVITVDKMIRIYQDAQFDSFRVLLLTETLQDMLKLVEGGIDISKLGVDVGSLAYAVDMTMLTDAIAVGKDEIATIRALHDHGLNVYAQKIPNDSRKDLIKMLDKNGL
ncbi:PTS system mannose/fructose/N-acetylgalactosamine-transporter subunit IIB [Pediococcus stilesii]|uniref:PTS family porter, mannose fructose-specific component IIB n=1 Tax=Pediococcus stilesii TaxID=331679 RepID=A0A0R2KUT8_9LACO|nr:PTS sugar transporter subunit IIB [Pediococcus stilesii]KRN93331.1 PTS family porter, mannose fructose-specific component IIB [Pediococcus stilesii]TLQ03982.1 PTS sugar transporter subunit IIB [Pediococcus stilesii]